LVLAVLVLQVAQLLTQHKMAQLLFLALLLP
jgi:hypothetical protein